LPASSIRSAATVDRGERDYAGRQQQHHPARKKEPGGIDQVRINDINVHNSTFLQTAGSADPSAIQVCFAGELFVFVHNFADGIKPAERCQVHIGERSLNL
jgi:hypothetical protein